MNFWLFVLCPFLMVRRAAHVAARIAAVLAKGTVSAGILLRRLFIHRYILQPFATKKLNPFFLIKCEWILNYGIPRNHFFYHNNHRPPCQP